MNAKLSNVCFCWLIETNAESMLWGRLISLNHFNKLLLCHSIKDACCFRANLKHRSCRVIVWFHTSKIPSAEFFEVDNPILIQIKICKCPIKFLIRERMSKLLWERLQLIFINSATTICIELTESLLNLGIFKLLIGRNHFFECVSKWFSSSGGTFVENAGVRINKSLFKMFLDETLQVVIVLWFLHLIRDSIVHDWHLCIVDIVIILGFELFDTDIFHKDD